MLYAAGANSYNVTINVNPGEKVTTYNGTYIAGDCCRVPTPYPK